MTAVTMEPASKDFLEFMWLTNRTRDAKFGELRIINDGKVSQAYIPLDSIDAITKMRFGERDDIYYGVLPRVRQSGTADAVVNMTRWLWADFDNKKVSAGKAFFSLMRSPVVPSVIIDSGHGYHAYWLLDKFEPFSVAADVMKNISHFFGGDHVQDAPRVLRVPWTTNWKDRDNPIPVRMIKWDMTDVGYPIEAFDRLLPVPERPNVLPSVRREETDKLLIPLWLRDLIEERQFKGTRSEKCFKVVLWLIRFGYSYEDIEQVFRENPEGVGEKYHERGNGSRWLTTVYRAASEAAL